MIIFHQAMRLLNKKSNPARRYQTPKRLFICFILNLNEPQMNGVAHKVTWKRCFPQASGEKGLYNNIIARKFGQQPNTAFVMHATGMQPIQKWHVSSCVARFY